MPRKSNLFYRSAFLLFYLALTAFVLLATDVLLTGNARSLNHGRILGSSTDHGTDYGAEYGSGDGHEYSPDGQEYGTGSNHYGSEGGHSYSSHGGGDHEGGHSLFGVVSSLNKLIGSVSVVIIIAAVLFVEYLFDSLHAITHDTPFQHMVSTIEKELMIVGCTAFIFKLIINGYQDMPSDWFVCLEYADLLVPIFSFAYCGLGFILIVMSIKQCHQWSKAHHLHLVKVLDVYFDRLHSWKNKFVWAGINQNLSEIEFRVFHQIFCDTFRIQRSAMPFDLYVEKVFEKFVLSIIEIRPIDWFMLVVVILLNLARKELKLDYYHCEEHDYHCDDRGTTILFIIVGAIMLISTLSFVIISRCLELALMRKKGLHSIQEYPQFLLYSSDQDHTQDVYRLTAQGLKDSAEAVKSQANVSESNKAFFSSKQSKSKKLAQKLNLRSSRQIVRRNSIMAAQAQASKKSVWSQMSTMLGLSHKTMKADGSGRSGRSGKSAYQVAPMSRMDEIKAAQELVARQMSEFITTEVDEPRSIIREEEREDDDEGGAELAPITVPRGSIVVEYQPSRHSSGGESGDSIATGGNEEHGALVGVEGIEGGGFWNTTELISPKTEEQLLMQNYVPGPPDSRTGVDSPQTVKRNLAVKLKPIQGKTLLASETTLIQPKVESPPGVTPTHRDSSVETPTNRNQNDGSASPTNKSLINSGDKKRTPNSGDFGVAAASEKTVHVHRTRPSMAKSSTYGTLGGVGLTSENGPSGKSFGIPGTADGYDDIDEIGGGTASSKPMGVADIENVLAGQDSEDLNTIFLFSNPALYFEGVQSLMMLISLYYALFLTNFIVAARTPGWIILCLVPALVSSILFIYVVKSAALLQAVYSLDNEAILEVIDQTEGTNHLLNVMRDRIISRLKEMGEPQAELYSLFSDINTHGKGDLTHKEFEIFMNALEINFTRRKWQQMFREVDKNFDNKISFDELFAFLFPDHDVFSALEKKQLKMIAVRVHEKVKELGAAYLKVGGAVAVSFHASHKLQDLPPDEAEGGFNLNLKMSNRREKRRNTTTIRSPREDLPTT